MTAPAPRDRPPAPPRRARSGGRSASAAPVAVAVALAAGLLAAAVVVTRGQAPPSAPAAAPVAAASPASPAPAGPPSATPTATGDTAAEPAVAGPRWPRRTDGLQRAIHTGTSPLVVRDAPSPTAEVAVLLPPRTSLGSPRVLLAGPARDGWVRVSLPQRPNGRSGWVDVRTVQLEPLQGEIVVDRAARRMTVRLGGATVADTPVGVGAAQWPTPAGVFFVTDRVAPPDPTGPYGRFALGLSGYSPTLTEFAGADGQVGIHGTDDPASIGRAVSHGCVRVPDDVADVLRRVPLGTPVVIR